MISLIGTLIGFGTSIVPEVLGYFKQKQANEQELRMLEAKAKYASQLSELRVKELDAEAEIQETKSLYEHDRTIDSGPIINSLRGSVRPVITYLFFLMFAAKLEMLVRNCGSPIPVVQPSVLNMTINLCLVFSLISMSILKMSDKP